MADRFHLDQWLLRALDDEVLSSLGGSEVYNWLLMSNTGILWKVIETSSLNRASESVIGKKHIISILIESVLWKQGFFFNFREKLLFIFPLSYTQNFLALVREKNCKLHNTNSLKCFLICCSMFCKDHQGKTWPPSFRVFLSKWFSSSVKDDCFLTFE